MKLWKDLPLEEKLKIEINELPLSKGTIKTLRKKGIYNLGNLVERYNSTIIRHLTHAERVYGEVTALCLAMDIFKPDNPDVYLGALSDYKNSEEEITARCSVYLTDKARESLSKRIKKRKRSFINIQSKIIDFAGRSGYSDMANYI